MPVGSLAVAFGVMSARAARDAATRRGTRSAALRLRLHGHAALNETFISATPLLFTGLCAAVAFRMHLFNIGGEGQLFVGAIFGAAAALALGNRSRLRSRSRR